MDVFLRRTADAIGLERLVQQVGILAIIGFQRRPRPGRLFRVIGGNLVQHMAACRRKICMWIGRVDHAGIARGVSDH